MVGRMALEKMVGTRLKPWRIVGLMSGTSLDGVDLAMVRFWHEGTWKYAVESTKYYPYSNQDRLLLKSYLNCSGVELIHAHTHWGKRFGTFIQQWLVQEQIPTPHLVASHGHTIYHQPHEGFTFQLGSGYDISETVNLPVVADFRSADVAAGGQGAPLVPFGEWHLFPEFDAFLNIGGIANGSIRQPDGMQAMDLCFANMWMNRSAEKMGQPFDRGGTLARMGVCHEELKTKLSDALLQTSKSLSVELVQETWQWIDDAELSVEDELRTELEAIVDIIHRKFTASGNILVTGGGAHHTFLMERLNTSNHQKFTAGSSELIDFKEAIIFAFLGLMRWLDQPNVFPQVTGARHAVKGGIIFQ